MLLQLLPDVQALIRKEQISVAFGEVMAPLDENRQRIALKYLAESKNPALKAFRILVGKLLADQAQNTMYDALQINPADVISESVEEHRAIRAAAYERRFPIDARVPQMQHVGTIGESMENFIFTLLKSDDAHLSQTVAPVVGSIYDSMLRAGMCFPPNVKNKSNKRSA